MSVGSCKIYWCNVIKYGGVCIVSGKHVSFDKDPIKRSLCYVPNCMFSQASNMDEVVQ